MIYKRKLLIKDIKNEISNIRTSFYFWLSASTQLIAEQQELNLHHAKNEKFSPSLQRFYKSVDALHIGLNKNLYYKILQQKPLALSVPKERIWPSNNDLKDKSGHIIKPRVQILMTTIIQTQYDETPPYNVEKLIDLLKQGYITVAQLNHFAGGDAVWLTVAGKLKEKMNERNKGWNFKLANSCQKIDLKDHNQDLDDNEKNPCNQIASIVGMYNPHLEDGTGYEGYTGYVNHVITFWIDKDAVVRPNKYQSIDNPNPGGFEVKQKENNLSPLLFDFGLLKGKTKWLSPIDQSVDKKYQSYGDWYQTWANNSFHKRTPHNSDNPAWPFPWTRYGFTYDWMHSNPGKGPLKEQLEKGIGLAEFITIPTPGVPKPVDQDSPKPNLSAIKFARKHYVVLANDKGQELDSSTNKTFTISEYLKTARS